MPIINSMYYSWTDFLVDLVVIDLNGNLVAPAEFLCLSVYQ